MLSVINGEAVSTYLYPEYHETSGPLGHSSTVARLVLSIVKVFDKPELWADEEKLDEDATMYPGFFTPAEPPPHYRYHKQLFVIAKQTVPQTLGECVNWAKAHWASRQLLELGMQIGERNVTQETYQDALKLIDRCIECDQHIVAI